MLSDILHKIRAQRDHEPTVISVGQIWVDITMHVQEMPQPGEFTNAPSVTKSASGSFHVLQAASRMGARTELASIMGTGPWATMLRDSLRRSHILHTGPTRPNQDNGFRIVLTDGMQKSYVAHHGAEAHGDPRAFAHVRPQRGDVVHISGNALMNESSLAVNAFIQQPQCRPQEREFRMVINPTNTLRLVNDQLLENLVLTRPIWSMNRQEARTLAYRLGVTFDESATMRVNAGFDESMHALCEALGETLRAPVVLRAGARGAWVRQHGKGVEHIDGFPTKATHIRSAGPAHTGALCALLAEGWDLESSVQIANAAASLAIEHNHAGIPFCPTCGEAAKLVSDALTAPKKD